MNEMIERMARAICLSEDASEPDDTCGGPHPMGLWLSEGEAWWTGYARSARIAVQAMREPTKAMLAAGINAAENCVDSDWDSGVDGEGYNSYETLRSDAPSVVWSAMIDAALAEERK